MSYSALISRRAIAAFIAATALVGPAIAQQASSSKPVAGGELIYYDYLAPTSFQLQGTLFFQNSGISNQIVDRLVYRDPKTGDISPWLATSWKTNEALTEFTFVLRDGVTFSDGSALDAETVKFNLDVLANGDKEKGIPRNALFPSYNRAEVVDAKTVRVVLDQSSSSFLDTLSDWRAGIVSKKTYSLPLAEQSKIENLIGSGPFVFESQKRGKELVIKRRPDYKWAPEQATNKGAAYLERVRYVTVPEDSVRIGALLSGQADAVRYVPPVDEQRLKQRGLQIWSGPVPGIVQQLTFHPESEFGTDQRVRAAVQRAIDRKEVVDTVFSPSYPAATSVLDPAIPGYVDLSDLLKYDPAGAEKLLDEAGWARKGKDIRTKDGKELVLSVYVAPYYIKSKELQELLAAQLERVGIRLDVRATDPGTYVAATETNKTTFVQTNRARGSGDILHQFYHTRVNNLLLAKTPELDALLDSFVSATNLKQRNDQLAKVQRYIIEQGYSIPLYEERQVFGLSTKVHGFSTETLGRPWFYETWLSK